MGPGDPFRSFSEPPARASTPSGLASVPPLQLGRKAGSLELRMVVGFAVGTGFGVCMLEIGLLRTLVIAGSGLVGTLLAARGEVIWRRLRRRR